jgi:DMSO/TMAO reductase YedYZ heme-binding membrane subunit
MTLALTLLNSAQDHKKNLRRTVLAYWNQCLAAWHTPNHRQADSGLNVVELKASDMFHWRYCC